MNRLTKLDQTICRVLDSPRTRKLADISGALLIAATFASAFWWFQ